MDNLKNGDNVLIIWKNDSQGNITSLIEDVKKVIQSDTVVLENSDMITEGKLYILVLNSQLVVLSNLKFLY